MLSGCPMSDFSLVILLCNYYIYLGILPDVDANAYMWCAYEQMPVGPDPRSLPPSTLWRSRLTSMLLACLRITTSTTATHFISSREVISQLGPAGERILHPIVSMGLLQPVSPPDRHHEPPQVSPAAIACW